MHRCLGLACCLAQGQHLMWFKLQMLSKSVALGYNLSPVVAKNFWKHFEIRILSQAEREMAF